MRQATNTKAQLKVSIIFFIKSKLLQLLYLFKNRTIKKHSQVTASKKTSLKKKLTVINPLRNPSIVDFGEKELELGKIHNLRILASRLDQSFIPKGVVFSFWKQAGRMNRNKGYTLGKEIRSGCFVPTIGGGTCLITNHLYELALKSQFEIIERHQHTQKVSTTAYDATVFWNYLDLKFRVTCDTMISFLMNHETLQITFSSNEEVIEAPQTKPPQPKQALANLKNCFSCQETTCFRAHHQKKEGRLIRTFLFDNYWPEIDLSIKQSSNKESELIIPIDGLKWNKNNFKWTTASFQTVKSLTVKCVLRSLKTRRLPKNGPVLQKKLFKLNQELYSSLAEKINPLSEALYTTNEIAIHLKPLKDLAGRELHLFLSRMPLRIMQKKLDNLFKTYPQSKTLGDFRVPEKIIQFEEELIKSAKTLRTAHFEIYSQLKILYSSKIELLPWETPSIQKNNYKKESGSILFPGSPLARKGVFELLDHAKKHRLKVYILKRALEHEKILDGIDFEYVSSLDEKAYDYIYYPSHIENNPRILLEAKAMGIEMILSEACGLGTKKALNKR